MDLVDIPTPNKPSVLVQKNVLVYKCLSCERYYPNLAELDNHPCAYWISKLAPPDSTAEHVPVCSDCAGGEKPDFDFYTKPCFYCENLYIERRFRIRYDPNENFLHHIFKCAICDLTYFKTCVITKPYHDGVWFKNGDCNFYVLVATIVLSIMFLAVIIATCVFHFGP